MAVCRGSDRGRRVGPVFFRMKESVFLKIANDFGMEREFRPLNYAVYTSRYKAKEGFPLEAACTKMGGGLQVASPERVDRRTFRYRPVAMDQIS